jgi:hypothetical protein
MTIPADELRSGQHHLFVKTGLERFQNRIQIGPHVNDYLVKCHTKYNDSIKIYSIFMQKNVKLS